MALALGSDTKRRTVYQSTDHSALVQTLLRSVATAVATAPEPLRILLCAPNRKQCREHVARIRALLKDASSLASGELRDDYMDIIRVHRGDDVFVDVDTMTPRGYDGDGDLAEIDLVIAISMELYPDYVISDLLSPYERHTRVVATIDANTPVSIAKSCKWTPFI